MTDREPLARQEAWWTVDDDREDDPSYYFAPLTRQSPPYKIQREVRAIIDIADDGTLAGVELIDDMPPPPLPTGKRRPQFCLGGANGGGKPKQKI